MHMISSALLFNKCIGLSSSSMKQKTLFLVLVWNQAVDLTGDEELRATPEHTPRLDFKFSISKSVQVLDAGLCLKQFR